MFFAAESFSFFKKNMLWFKIKFPGRGKIMPWNKIRSYQQDMVQMITGCK